MSTKWLSRMSRRLLFFCTHRRLTTVKPSNTQSSNEWAKKMWYVKYYDHARKRKSFHWYSMDDLSWVHCTEMKVNQKTCVHALIHMWKASGSLEAWAGWEDGSRGKSTCYQEWWPETNPQEPHHRRRKVTLGSCHCTATQMLRHMCTLYVHTNTWKF